ncbi:MAG: CotH kinase family protein [Oscillospiraceae bacterium]|nr:CotH kinase family protein [Oscillospiraceae bacterium]
MLACKYISKLTIVLMSVVLVLCILAMAFHDKLSPIVTTAGYSMDYQDALFDPNKILEIDIVMDAAQWDEMLQNARKEEYYECDIVINGAAFQQVGIRPKGNTSLSSIASDPDNDRYSFKLEFDQFLAGQTCFGLDKLILNNSYADPTNMKEAMIYDMFQYLDADASLYQYAKISVNGKYWGVYLALEAVEDSFMLRNYGTEKGYLYKPDGMNHNNGDQKFGDAFPAPQENGFPDREEMEAMMQKRQTERKQEERMPFPNREFGRGGPGNMGGGANLNYTDDVLDSYRSIWDGQVNDSSKADHMRVLNALKNIHRKTDLERYIDVEQVLKYMAVHNFSVNDDSLSGSMAHNYYLYESNEQISILPWDYNLAFGGMHGGSSGTTVINAPIDEPWQSTKLFDFVLENEEYKTRYHEYYQKLANGYFDSGRFEETYQRIRKQIDDLVKTDPNKMYTYEEYQRGANVLYDAMMLRVESIQGQLNGTIPSTSEGQKADASSLIDASHIRISDLGQFMGGGPGGDRKLPGKWHQPAANE